MPRFMGLVRMEEGIGTPPQSLFEAMDKYIGERAAKGVFLDGGGLYGTEDAVNFVVRQGQVSRVDGPYAEAKEVVGGGPRRSTTASRRPWPTSRSSPSCTRRTGRRSPWWRRCGRSPRAPRHRATDRGSLRWRCAGRDHDG